nr:YncE family protein [Chloroflexota bacterium]
MTNKLRSFVVLLVTVCLVFLFSHSGRAQQVKTLSALILNGDFEGDFYPYGAGYVAQYWIPYDLSPGSPPQYLRSTLHKYEGQASQMIWADSVPWYAGIMQTTLLTSAQSTVSIQAGKRYTVRVWVYSIYGGATSPVQHGKLNKRVGVHPAGGVNPKSSDIVWTPWHGQDKTWVQINASVEAKSNRLTIFIEANDPVSGGQDQFYVDNVLIEEEGAPPPTSTPTWTPLPTATPTPTATPAIAVQRTIPVGRQPQGIAVHPNTNRFFVANSGENSVSSLEGFLDWRHTRFSSGGGNPGNIAVDPEQCRMYVANAATNSIAVFNICTNQQVGSIPLGTGQSPSGIAVLTTTNTIYVANTAANSVMLIDGNTLTVSKTIAVGLLPGQIATNPSTNKVYVTNRGYPPSDVGGVTVINANTQSIYKTIAFNEAPEPYGVAVNPITNRIYVASASGMLVIINGATDEILYVVPSPGHSGLDVVAVNPASNNVFATSSTGSMVFVYDADMDQWIYTLPIGSGRYRGIAVNPLTYHVLVSNTGEDTVSVLRDHGFYQPYKLQLPIIVK